MQSFYTQWISTPEDLLYDDPDGRFTLTRTLHQVNGTFKTHIHFKVHIWSPSTLREVDRIFPIQRARLPAIIGAMPADPSPTFDKFVRRYGWTKIRDVPCDDGITRPFYTHSL